MHEAGQKLPKETFLKALDLLNEQFKEVDHHITFLAVGGAVMMLSLGARNLTEDIDGVLEPADKNTAQLFHLFAEDVATELGISPKWINTRVEHIMKDQLFQKSYFEEVPGLRWSHITLLFAKPGYVLAMKCQSMRFGKQDYNDIVALIRHFGIRTFEQLQAEVEKFIPRPVASEKLVKICIAWAYPGQTEYDNLRLELIEQARKAKT